MSTPIPNDEDLVNYAVSLLRPPDERKDEAILAVELLANTYSVRLPETQLPPSVHRRMLRDIATAFEKAAAVYAEYRDEVGDWWIKAEMKLTHYRGVDDLDLRPTGPTTEEICAQLVKISQTAKTAADIAKEAMTRGQRPAVAKREIAFYALPIFESFRPGAASSSIDGDFYDFVATICEIATGNREDVERAVKTVCRLRKRRHRKKPTIPTADAN